MTVKDVIKEYNQKGLTQMSSGVKFPDSPRLPTGNFAMDYAMGCLLYTSPSPRDQRGSRMPSSA